jgi:hypothetical protein
MKATTIAAAVVIGALHAAPALAQPMPVQKLGSCPSGYRESGGYCAPMNDRAQPAIPKRGQCPSGWAQSGNYCIRMPGPLRRG